MPSLKARKTRTYSEAQSGKYENKEASYKGELASPESEQAKQLASQYERKETQLVPNLEYGEVTLSFQVRAKGSDKAWTHKKFQLTPNGKGSVNYQTFKPNEASGVLTSTKGVYLPKATSKSNSKDS